MGSHGSQGPRSPSPLQPVKKIHLCTCFQYTVFTSLCHWIMPVSEIISTPLPSHPWWHIKTRPTPSILSPTSPPPRCLPIAPVRALVEAHGYAEPFYRLTSPSRLWVSREQEPGSVQLCVPHHTQFRRISSALYVFFEWLNTWRKEPAPSSLQHLLHYLCKN